MKINESDKEYFPNDLLILIQECINLNPYERPSFNDILLRFERRFINFEEIGIMIEDPYIHEYLCKKI